MAIDAFLYIDGRKGPSQKRKDAIDILSFSFGGSMASTYGAGASGSESVAGRVQVSDATFMKVTDKLTPELFRDMCTGHHFPYVKLEYEKPIGDQQEPFFRVLMEDAIITSLQLSGSSEVPVESISFAFEKIKVSYNPEGDDGKLQGFVDGGFDLGKLTKW